MRSYLLRLLPELPPFSSRERLRCSTGALVGVLATGLISQAAVGDDTLLPALIAPMGASAVLLFAVPASPLAQPWSLLGGNLVAAVVGVTAAGMVSNPFFASALAIGGAIGLMLALRCLHPPSGAVALTAVLGGTAIRDLGYEFVLWPVGANSLLLLTTALLYNNLTGRSYPHVAPKTLASHGTKDPAPSSRVGVTSSDLDALLEKQVQRLDIGRSDLEAIVRQAERRFILRRSGRTTCSDIMSRDVIAVGPGTPLHEALHLLRERHIKALPVTEERGGVLGIVTQTDFLDKAAWDRRGPRLGWGDRVRLTLRRGRAPSGGVEDIMTAPARTVRPETPIAEAAWQMSDGAMHHLPVVGSGGKLLGIISQSDLLVALLADTARREGS